MSDKKENSSKIIIIAMIVVVLLIVIIIGMLVFYSQKGNRKIVNDNPIIENEIYRKPQTNNNQVNTNNINNQVNNNQINTNQINTSISNTNANNEKVSPIPLNIKGKQSMNGGGELILINDYKILIPDELAKIGYKVNQKNNVLAIQANDNSYSCVLMQISDNYVMPTEEEIDGFYETREYKEWDAIEYDIDNEAETNAHYDRYSEISSTYYKNLGYTVKNCPDYTLTEKEEQELIGGYLLEGKELSSGSNGLFPGYEKYSVYDWGKYSLFTIPKYYKDSTFGEKTSNFSICMYLFEYYDREKINFNVDLWRF